MTCAVCLSRAHGYLPEECRPEHTIVVITTDGMENASRGYGYEQVKAMISQKEEDFPSSFAMYETMKID